MIAQLKKLAEGEDDEDEEAREIEARRSRLAAIRAKHAQAGGSGVLTYVQCLAKCLIFT